MPKRFDSWLAANWRRFRAIAFTALATVFAHDGQLSAQQRTDLPHLESVHGATQLVVDGTPILLRAGELENSSASSTSVMAEVWPKLVAMHMNAVLAPAYWELIEPREGTFDFQSVDELILAALQHDMHAVLLWFGSWKNSMSSHVPAWVKRDPARFPRALRSDGTPLEILSALNKETLDADGRAFAASPRVASRSVARDSTGTTDSIDTIHCDRPLG